MKVPLLRICVLACLAILPGAGFAQVPEQDAVLCADLEKPFFSVVCAKDGSCRAVPQRRQSSAVEFSVPKPAGVKRVFVLGESVAGLLSTVDALNVRVPGLEVINCGMGGYETSRIKDVFLEILKYEPDLVVVLSGNNEGGTFRCPGFSSAMRERWARLTERYYGLRNDAKLARIKTTLKIQETRLDFMAALARKRKVPLILCTLPANLAVPPFGALPLASGPFAEGMVLFEKGALEKAAAKFELALRENRYDLFSRFYLGKTMEALKRFGDARENYLGVLELDPGQNRTSATRNYMIKKVAARRGAGLCDLESAVYALSKNGIPGFTQFTDAMHWWPSYNSLAWYEIARTARGMGAAAFKDPLPYRPPALLSEQELRKSFSYALAYIDNSCLSQNEAGNGVLCEKTVAEINFIEAERPGLLEKVSRSDEAFSDFFINNFWSAQTAARLGTLRPFFIAHLAEMERRRGRFEKALSLLEAASPVRPYYKLIKGRALLGLGRKKEGQRELEALFGAPALGLEARTVAAAYGISVPAAAPVKSVPVTQKARADSKKISDGAVEKMRSGDLPAAERMLYSARALNPANAEALLSLCSLEFSKGELTKALDACGAVAGAAALDRHPARQTMEADSLYIKALVFLKLGKPLEAGKYFKLALATAPKGWENLGRARAELGRIPAKQAGGSSSGGKAKRPITALP